MEELLRLPPSFDPPLMNAAGTLGFAPDRRKPLDWAQFGAFVTNPISVRPRRPAGGTRWRVSANTALVHTGLPNPGYRKAINQYAHHWAQADLPVIVHLMSDAPSEMARIIPKFEVLENVIAIELGFPENIGASALKQIVAASLGELPTLVCLPFSRAVELAPAVIDSGVAAVSVSAPRGELPDTSGGFDRGRLYGPAIFPQALHIVRQLSEMEIPVIGAGGVYAQEQAEAMRRAGALAVQLDLVLWRGDWLIGNQED